MTWNRDKKSWRGEAVKLRMLKVGFWELVAEARAFFGC